MMSVNTENKQFSLVLNQNLALANSINDSFLSLWRSSLDSASLLAEHSSSLLSEYLDHRKRQYDSLVETFQKIGQQSQVHYHEWAEDLKGQSLKSA